MKDHKELQLGDLVVVEDGNIRQEDGSSYNGSIGHITEIDLDYKYPYRVYISKYDYNVWSTIKRKATPEEINPTKSITDLVIEDMNVRKEFGRTKYGTYLYANNGRDALQDAYEEAMDLYTTR